MRLLHEKSSDGRDDVGGEVIQQGDKLSFFETKYHGWLEGGFESLLRAPDGKLVLRLDGEDGEVPVFIGVGKLTEYVAPFVAAKWLEGAHDLAAPTGKTLQAVRCLAMPIPLI